MKSISTWICDLMPRFVSAGLALVALTGCSLPVPQAETPPQSLALLGGAVSAAGPAGYCVDVNSSKPADGFALLAACSAITGDSTGAFPRLNGVLTVQAGESGSAFIVGSESEVLAYLQTEGGASLLGGPVEVLGGDAGDAFVSVYFRDLTAGRLANTQSEVWRVFTDIADRSVTISLRGLASEPLSHTEGKRLLQGALATLRAANEQSN
jgi:hypothetical protein